MRRSRGTTVVAIIRTSIVPIVVLATLLGCAAGTMHVDMPRTGMIRQHPCSLDVARVENSADAEIDDTDVDPTESGWLDGSPQTPAQLQHVAGRHDLARRVFIDPRHGCAVSLIRGPPGRC